MEPNTEPIRKLAEKMEHSTIPPVQEFTSYVVYGFQQFPFIGVLILLITLDIVTGYIAAAVSKEIDSTVSFRGALKKAQMILMVAAGVVFELLYPDVPWGKLIAGLLCISEMTSIIENADKAGVPIPNALRDTMKRLRSAEKDKAPEAIIKVDVHTSNEVQPGPAGPPGPKGDKGDPA